MNCASADAATDAHPLPCLDAFVAAVPHMLLVCRGPIAAVFLCLLPIALLLLTTLLRRLSLPSGTSLPAAAALLAFIRLAYFSCPPVLVAGSVLKGVLEALTPLSVIYGAILLFETMQHTMVRNSHHHMLPMLND